MRHLLQPLEHTVPEVGDPFRSVDDARHSEKDGASQNGLGLNTKWILTGLSLVGLHLALFWISSGFGHGRVDLTKPIPSLVIIEVAAGAIYFFAIRRIRDSVPTKWFLVWVGAIGIILRALTLTSTPMLEDDFNRYLWDGAVLANGVNPYRYSPDDVRYPHDANSIPTVLRALAEEPGSTIGRINHPYLRTIYPPVAQVIFGVSYVLDPWSLTAWRLILFGFDLCTLGLVIVTLRTLNLPILRSMVYWWNPLLIREIFNTAHMDVVVLPFILGSLLLVIRGWRFGAVSMLALAVGVKIWPILLLPFILRQMGPNLRRFIPTVLLFIFLTMALFMPVFSGGLPRDSGFMAYGQHWEMNDSVFMLFLWSSQGVLRLLGVGVGYDQLLTRIGIAVLLAFWIARLLRGKASTLFAFYERCLLAVAALFLLGPTQFPWYYVWILPLLAICPRRALLLLTLLLPFYYLRFYFDAHGHVDLFDNGVVWIEFLPVWGLLIWEWFVPRPRWINPFSGVTL